MPEPAYDQLLEENRALKNKVIHLEQSNEKLLESGQMYSALFKHAGFSIVLLDEGTGETVLFNNKAHEMLGYTEEEFKGLSLKDIDKDGDPRGLEKHLEYVRNRGSYTFRTVHRTKNNEILHMLISSVAVNINGKYFHQSIGIDITNMVTMEKELKKIRAELEKRVAERTVALQEKTENLKEMNIALNVLLEKRSADRKDLEENILENIKELVNPYLQLLNQGNPTERQKNYLKIIESSLNDITSQFTKKLSDKLMNLSPAEIKVANLIKQGQTTKEIALLLNLSHKTIEAHRNRIRKKIGLTHRKISLQTYLSTV